MNCKRRDPQAIIIQSSTMAGEFNGTICLICARTLTEVGPVSAFAAREVEQNRIEKVTDPLVADQLVFPDSIPEIEAPIRSRKRRKRAQSPQDDLPAFQHEKQNDQRDELEPASKDMILLEGGSSGANSSRHEERYVIAYARIQCRYQRLHSSESELDVQSPTLVQRLSTFVPTKKYILSDTEKEWTVVLQPSDVWVRDFFRRMT